LPSANSTYTLRASRRFGTSPVVTTWALVAMSPSPLSTKPEPTPLLESCRSASVSAPNSETTVTTPGASCL
jgi:hypothetical protein